MEKGEEITPGTQRHFCLPRNFCSQHQHAFAGGQTPETFDLDEMERRFKTLCETPQTFLRRSVASLCLTIGHDAAAQWAAANRARVARTQAREINAPLVGQQWDRLVHGVEAQP